MMDFLDFLFVLGFVLINREYRVGDNIMYAYPIEENNEQFEDPGEIVQKDDNRRKFVTIASEKSRFAVQLAKLDKSALYQLY